MSKAKPWVINCTESEDRTRQSFRAECDINNIVSRIKKTGFVPLQTQESLRRQVYGDASVVPQSLEEAYAVVARADAAFASLPARLRERFQHPAGLLRFIENPENLKEAVDLGLLAKTQPMPNSGPNSGPLESSGNNEAVPQAKPATGAPEPAK